MGSTRDSQLPPGGSVPASESESVDADLPPEQEDEEECEDDCEEEVEEQLPAVAERLSDTHEVLSQKKSLVVSGSHGTLSSINAIELKGDEYRLSTWARFVKERREFEFFISVAITFNAVSLGLSADFSIKNPGGGIPQYFRVFDYLFLFVFALELLVRLAAEGRSFFHRKSPTFQWNMFDTVLVGATILNEGTFGLNLSVIRVFRVLRLANVVRMIRLMKGFRELRLLVSGMMNCGKTLLWSIILLVVVAYIYAVFCLQMASEWLAEEDVVVPGQGALGAQILSTKLALDDHFPSLWYSVYTLFKTVSGGISWGEIADPLASVSSLLLFSFPLYIMITVFCVLNIITASFVEAAHRTVQAEDTNALDHIKERQRWIKQIRQLFSKHDQNLDDLLDWNEFLNVMSDWRTQAYFTEHGLTFDFQHALTMFRLFDWDGSGCIDVNEFAQGVHHLRGNARSLDMFREFQALSRKMDRMMHRLEKASPSRRPTISASTGTASHALAAASRSVAQDDECWHDEPSVRGNASSEQLSI